MKFIDLTGQIFGRLTVIQRVGTSKDGYVRWECRCICGNTTMCNSGSLHSGNTKSCGCLGREKLGNLVHGKSKIPEYKIWKSMKGRCLNRGDKAFVNYGGRNITIYPPWINDFPAFYNYLSPRPTPLHTIERIDNNGNYEPGNVKWATRKEQNNNRRDNYKITFNGQTKSIAQWAEVFGMNKEVLRRRIVVRGWSIEKSLSEPVQYHRKPSQSHTAPSVKSPPPE